MPRVFSGMSIAKERRAMHPDDGAPVSIHQLKCAVLSRSLGRSETQQLRFQRGKLEFGLEVRFPDQIEPFPGAFQLNPARFEIVVDQIDQPRSFSVRNQMPLLPSSCATFTAAGSGATPLR